MKRWIYSNDHLTDHLTLDIQVYYYRTDIEGASILDVTDPAFQAFELDVLEACDIHDFQLIEDYSSPVKGSISHYYKYIKTNKEGTKLEVFLKIRVSDHAIDNDISRNISNYAKRDQDYINKEAKKYAQEHFNQPRGYRGRRIDIVFNDDNYTSYEAALRAIEDKLDQFDPE